MIPLLCLSHDFGAVPVRCSFLYHFDDSDHYQYSVRPRCSSDCTALAWWSMIVLNQCINAHRVDSRTYRTSRSRCIPEYLTSSCYKGLVISPFSSGAGGSDDCLAERGIISGSQMIGARVVLLLVVPQPPLAVYDIWIPYVESRVSTLAGLRCNVT